MAEPIRPDSHDEHDNPPEAGHRANGNTGSWIDGLPHNFSGWGPRTPDPEHPQDVIHTDEELMWNGEGEHRHHYVWNFQRSRHHHH
jgi:hypothetical protein